MKRQNAFALIVGIGKYQDPAISPLKYTNADARAFAELLTDDECCGVPEENVKLLIDEEATLFAIKDAISGWLAKSAGPDSTAILFFAGHGDVEPDRTQLSTDALSNYLLPYDTNASNLFASALSKEQFQHLVRTVRSKRSVILMDACHSGGVATAGSRKMSVGYSKDLYSSLAEGSGSTVIAAAAPNQLSWEDDSIGHGVFTHHLIEALRGAADYDGDGRITMMEVFDYLKRTVPESARKLGRAEQTPVFKADMSEDIVLTINPARMREIEEANNAKAEAERARIRKLNSDLFQVYQERGLSRKVYNFATELIEKPQDELSAEERGTLELMNAMVAEHVSVDTFTRHCENQMKAPEPAPPPAAPPKAEPPPAAQREPVGAGQGVTSRSPTRSATVESPAETVSLGLNVAMVLLSIFIPLIGGIVGLVFVIQGKDEKRRAGKRWLWISGASFVCWFLLGACANLMQMSQYDAYGY